ncbi:MAG: CPBP family intramembrane metalloprotease [Oscillospiraceae bacterium]|nr:CPBP family intramembrane metalloprotease [Oscillospiraceae bacterium]
MYQPKQKSYGIIAVIYYCIYFGGLFLAGILYQKGIMLGMNIIYCSLFAVGVLIALIKDRNIDNLGFGKEKLRMNLIISLIIVVTTFIAIWIFSDLAFNELFQQMLYYLFYIAAIEEILFRGLIQNYLFGFKLNKYVTFIIGALLFSFMHIPFQMVAHNNVSLHYLVEALPNLIETFIAHFAFCLIAYKCKDITISIAVHYAYDFLGVII